MKDAWRRLLISNPIVDDDDAVKNNVKRNQRENVVVFAIGSSSRDVWMKMKNKTDPKQISLGPQSVSLFG